MFVQMREVLGISKGTDILDHIYSLPTLAEQASAMEAIRAIERAAMASQVPQPGLTELMEYLDTRGIRKAICTRNFEQPVQHLLSSFLPGSVFETIVTRDFRPPKPHPAGIWHIAKTWGLVRPPEVADPEASAAGAGAVGGGAVAAAVPTDQRGDDGDAARFLLAAGTPDASCLIMVGDSIDDMTAGRMAGCATVLLRNAVNAHLSEHAHTDLVVERLDELVAVLENGFFSGGGPGVADTECVGDGEGTEDAVVDGARTDEERQ